MLRLRIDVLASKTREEESEAIAYLDGSEWGWVTLTALACNASDTYNTSANNHHPLSCIFLVYFSATPPSIDRLRREKKER